MLPVFFQHFAHKVGSTWSKFHAISIAWALKKSTFDSTPRLAKNNICAQCTGKKKPNGEAQSYCDYNIISFVSECCESYFLWSTNILPLIASRSLTSFQQTYKFNPGCWLRPSTLGLEILGNTWLNCWCSLLQSRVKILKLRHGYWLQTRSLSG
jgi:hypothetical protein